jgi:hypothetical protein
MGVRPNVLAINNAATVVRPTLWIGSDKPVCFAKSIIYDPSYMKFVRICRRNELVDGRPWHTFPNTLFFGDKEGFTKHDFLKSDRDLVWWKNTFFTALQLAHRLGFQTVHLVGCGFKISEGSQYAWPTGLDSEEVASNKRLYSRTVLHLESLLPHFEREGFKVISCTPGSLANDILPYEEAEAVLEGYRAAIPVVETARLPHSSKAREAVEV